MAIFGKLLSGTATAAALGAAFAATPVAGTAGQAPTRHPSFVFRKRTRR